MMPGVQRLTRTHIAEAGVSTSCCCATLSVHSCFIFNAATCTSASKTRMREQLMLMCKAPHTEVFSFQKLGRVFVCYGAMVERQNLNQAGV